MTDSGTPVVCVDFDGVIAAFSDLIDDFGPTLPGAVESIGELRRLGCRIIIHTARPSTPEHIGQLAEHLRHEGIPFDEINSNSECPWPTTKPLADLYIDDRACRFEGDWSATLRTAKAYLGLDGVAAPVSAYPSLLAKIATRRAEIDCFEAFLRSKTSWPTAPASTRFHLAKDGGLIEHSLNVVRTLLRLRECLAPDVSEESCVIVGLYHDVGKVGTAGQPYYLPNTSEWHVRNRGIKYVVNKDLVHMDIATRSLYLVSQHVPLSDAEAQAIRYHDGQYITENSSVAHREEKLTRLLQFADNWSGGVVEDRG